MGADTQTRTTVAVRPKAAKKDPKTDPTFFPQVFWATAILSGILLAAAVAIALFQRWRKRQTKAPITEFDQLASFRALYERGELSQEEFERIRRRIVGRLKPESAAAPPLPSPPQEPPPADPRISDQPPN